MIGHPAPGQSPERHALEAAALIAQIRAAAIAAQLKGFSFAVFQTLMTSEWQAVERLQTGAATEAGKNAQRRRGPRRQKGGR